MGSMGDRGLGDEEEEGRALGPSRKWFGRHTKAL